MRVSRAQPYVVRAWRWVLSLHFQRGSCCPEGREVLVMSGCIFWDVADSSKHPSLCYGAKLGLRVPVSFTSWVTVQACDVRCT